MHRLNIVLVEPQIPQNTGNISRTCAVTGAALHLVKPYGFTITDRQLKRAGLDYWDKLEIYEYDNLDSFFEKNGNRLGYNLNMDSRFYFCEWFALGLQYDYNNIQKGKDKAHVHFIRPALTLRYVMNRDALFFNLGVGLFNYQDRVYNINSRYNYYSNNISKNYCGISFTLGYEFPITGNLSGSVRADIQTANWFVNDDFRLFNPDKIGCDDDYEYCDKYDDGINHNLFKNDLTFCNFTFSLVFGK